MDLMGKNFQYIKHPKNVYAKFHTYLFVEFLCHINEYFKVLFQLILLVAQYKYDRHFMSHLVIKSKVHYACITRSKHMTRRNHVRRRRKKLHERFVRNYYAGS